MSVDWSRPVQTNGKPPLSCQLLTPEPLVNTNGGWTRVVLVRQPSGTGYLYTTREDGTTNWGFRLVNVPEKHSKILNIYRVPCCDRFAFDWQVRLFDSESAAKRAGSPHMFASIPIEFTEGEGL